MHNDKDQISLTINMSKELYERIDTLSKERWISTPSTLHYLIVQGLMAEEHINTDI